MTPERETPTGLDMNPRPPDTVRVRKGVGVAAMAVIGILALLIVYGVYARQQRQVQASSIADLDRKATPATSASHEFTSTIPAGDAPQLKQEIPSLVDQTRPEAVNPPKGSVPRVTAGPAPRMQPLTPPSPAFPFENSIAQADDRERDLAYQKEQAAIEAPTGIGGSGRGYGGSANLGYSGGLPPSSNSTPQMFHESGSEIRVPGTTGGDARAGLGSMSQGGEYNAQNAQDQKTAFIAQARNRVPQNYLPSVQTAPVSKFEIEAGWDIPATLEQSINSDQPGEIKALVRENVFDTATGKYVLLPQGSRLIGSYSSAVSYGQDGVQAVWDRASYFRTLPLSTSTA